MSSMHHYRLLFMLTVFLFFIQSTDGTIYSCNQNATCGCSMNPVTATRIVGGEEAGTATWGWAVSIRIDGITLCGGSILSNRWILTAAHCVHNIQPSSVEIYAGSNVRWSGTQIRNASRIISHPCYTEETNKNDIALVELALPLSLSDPFVKSICLPPVESETLFTEEWPAAGTAVIVIGWGHLAVYSITPCMLQQVTLEIIDYQASTCSSILEDHEVQICAGVSDGDKDTCQGDSGGPLMMFDSSERWVLVGVTSYAYGCGVSEHQGVYTRVAAYRNWIDSYIIESLNTTTTVPTTTESYSPPLISIGSILRRSFFGVVIPLMFRSIIVSDF